MPTPMPKPAVTAPNRNIIDVISAGFRATGHHAWWLVFPILLDLVLWLGPRISIRPLLLQLSSQLQISAQLAGDPSSSANAEMLRQSQQMVEQLANQINLLSALSGRVIGWSSLPSLLVTLPVSQSAILTTPGTWEIGSTGQALLLALALVVLGLGLASIYLRTMVAGLRSEPLDLAAFLLGVVRSWARLVALLLGLLLLSLVVVLPLFMLTVIVAVFSPQLATGMMGLLSVLALWVGLWLFLVLFFAAEAIVLDDVGIVAAAWRSANVVMRNFWSTTGLVVISWLLTQGFSLIWERIGSTPAGIFLAIVGNAYLGTALVAAYFIFYRERYIRWHESTVSKARVKLS